MLRREWLTLVLLVTSLFVIAFSWGSLPEKLPIHWGVNGQPDVYGNKVMALLFPFGLMFLLIMLSFILDKAEPKNMQVLRVMRLGLSIVGLAMLSTVALQWPNARFIMIAVGILILLVGNLVGKTKPNHWVGVRLPWVFKSQRSWYATQRRGAAGLTLIGIVLTLCFLVLPASILFSLLSFSALSISIVGLAIWLSYTSYQEYKNDPDPQPVSKNGAV